MSTNTLYHPTFSLSSTWGWWTALEDDSHTQPTPIPDLALASTFCHSTDSAAPPQSVFNIPAKDPDAEHSKELEQISPTALTVSITQFMLGAYLWVTGQQGLAIIVYRSWILGGV